MIKPTTAMLIGRIEAQLKSAENDPALYVPPDLMIKSATLRTLIETIRELESEVKKKHHKPHYDTIGKPTYYSPE